MASPFQKLQDLPSYFFGYIPKPSVCQNNEGDDCILIASDWEEDNAGIYRYQFKTNELNLIHKYDGNLLKPEYHEQFINKENHILYIFGGSKKSFGAFNLKTKSMEYNSPNTLSRIGRYPSTTFIPSPVNQIHAYSHPNYLKYQINDQNIIKVNASELINNIKRPKLLYIPSKKQLMIFGAHNNDKIWHCDIEQDSNQNDYHWKLNKLKMSHSVDFDEYNVVLGFENVIFTFYFPFSDHSYIYCFDLLNHQWFKSKYKVPECINSVRNMYVIKIGNNAHILDFEGKHHFKVDFNDLVPNELIKSQREYFKALILGYMKKRRK